MQNLVKMTLTRSTKSIDDFAEEILHTGKPLGFLIPSSGDTSDNDRCKKSDWNYAAKLHREKELTKELTLNAKSFTNSVLTTLLAEDLIAVGTLDNQVAIGYTVVSSFIERIDPTYRTFVKRHGLVHDVLLQRLLHTHRIPLGTLSVWLGYNEPQENSDTYARIYRASAVEKAEGTLWDHLEKMAATHKSFDYKWERLDLIMLGKVLYKSRFNRKVTIKIARPFDASKSRHDWEHLNSVFREAQDLEYELFEDAGYAEPADKKIRRIMHFDKYTLRENTAIALAYYEGESAGIMRMNFSHSDAKKLEDVGFETISDPYLKRFPYAEKIMSIPPQLTADIGSIAVKKKFQGRKFLIYPILVNAGVDFMLKEGKRIAFAGVDHPYFNGLNSLYPMIPIGETDYYMGSVCVPSVLDARIYKRYTDFMRLCHSGYVLVN